MLNAMCLDKNGNSIDHLTQWDYNQKLIINSQGLDVSGLSQIQFCNRESTEALCVTAKLNSDGNIEAAIPNQLLMKPYPIYAYVWVSDIESGKTQYAITIPVRKRVKPHDFEFVENIETIDVIQLREDVIELTNHLEEIKNNLNDKLDKTQYASTTQAGAVKLETDNNGVNISGLKVDADGSISIVADYLNYGILSDVSGLQIESASYDEIAKQKQQYKPIVPSTLSYAVQTIGGELNTLNTNDKSSYAASINEVIRDVKYTNLSPTPITIGGITSGTTFNNENIKDILGRLLYPYVPFKINTGNTSNGTIRYIEEGNSLTVSSVSISITKGSKDITSFTINAGENLIADAAAIEKYNDLLSGMSDNAITSVNYITPTTGTSTVKVTVSDGTDTKTHTIYTYYHVYAYYYGCVSTDNKIASITNNENLTAAETNMLNKMSIGAYGDKTPPVFKPAKQYIVFLSPKKLTDIYAMVGTTETDSEFDNFNEIPVKVNEISYYLYRYKFPTDDTENGYKYKFKG